GLLVFDNIGDREIFISSADWMTRNLDERVEVSCPIYDPAIKKMLSDIMAIQLADNQKARIIDADQKNAYVSRGNRRKIRSQEEIHDYLTRLAVTSRSRAAVIAARQRKAMTSQRWLCPRARPGATRALTGFFGQ